jgi:hypothetical protein
MEMTDAPCTTMGRDHRRKSEIVRSPFLGVRALVLLKKVKGFFVRLSRKSLPRIKGFFFAGCGSHDACLHISLVSDFLAFGFVDKNIPSGN